MKKKDEEVKVLIDSITEKNRLIKKNVDLIEDLKR
jgi:hypothetical protein